MRRKRRASLRGFLALLFLIVAALATVQFWIGLLIYRPAPLTQTDPRVWGITGATFMQAHYGDGTAITGWWAPPANAANPVLLILHGRSANMSTRAPIMKSLAADGFGVLMIDYRGYGASSGTPSEAHLAEDAQTAYRWLRSKGVAADRVVVIGQSLGNGPASALAAREPVGALILVAPFTSLPGALSERLPWLPVQLVPWTRNRFDVLANLAASKGPILLIASEEDGLVPITNGQKVRTLNPDAAWLDVSPLRHDGMLLAVARTGRLARAIGGLMHKPKILPTGGEGDRDAQRRGGGGLPPSAAVQSER